jgi:hypothetical protein
MILCRVGYTSHTPVRQFAVYSRMGRRRPIIAVSSRPTWCTLFFMMFCIKKLVRTVKCFGFKQWQLLATGNSFSCGLVGWGHKFVTLFWNGGQTFVTKCEKRGWGSILHNNRETSFMDDLLKQDFLCLV